MTSAMVTSSSTTSTRAAGVITIERTVAGADAGATTWASSPIRKRSGAAQYVEPMPSDLTFKVLNAFHRGVLKLSGGRLGWNSASMPVVELTTTGRTSGQPRTVM